MNEDEFSLSQCSWKSSLDCISRIPFSPIRLPTVAESRRRVSLPSLVAESQETIRGCIRLGLGGGGGVLRASSLWAWMRG